MHAIRESGEATKSRGIFHVTLLTLNRKRVDEKGKGLMKRDKEWLVVEVLTLIYVTWVIDATISFSCLFLYPFYHSIDCLLTLK